MRTTRTAVSVTPILALLMAVAPAAAQDESRAVAGGGIAVPGWSGKIDAREAANGATLNDARLAMDGQALHAVTGPAVAYWKDDATASGDYMVSATFTEPAYMALNNHPHPYGIFIGGQNMGTDQQSYLYCATYGSGTFIVRGFGPEAFQLNGRRGEAHDAVNKAPGEGQPVTQQITLAVRGDVVQCSVNGTVVGSYPKADVVGEAKLSSTDGVYGIRLGHNTEARVTGLSVMQH
ncbi:MAG: hypothetical protein WEB88_11415 [Gemmatimonadota bacterium]